MIPRHSLDDPGAILETLKNHHFHIKIVEISAAVEVFQVPLAKVRVEIERRIKMMTPGLWNFEIRPQASHEMSIKVENFDPPLQVQKCQHRPHPAKMKQAQIEEECFAPYIYIYNKNGPQKMAKKMNQKKSHASTNWWIHGKMVVCFSATDPGHV